MMVAPGPAGKGGRAGSRAGGVEPEASVRDLSSHRRLSGLLPGTWDVGQVVCGGHCTCCQRRRTGGAAPRLPTLNRDHRPWGSHHPSWREEGPAALRAPAWGPPARRGVSFAFSCFWGQHLRPGRRAQVGGQSSPPLPGLLGSWALWFSASPCTDQLSPPPFRGTDCHPKSLPSSRRCLTTELCFQGSLSPKTVGDVRQQREQSTLFQNSVSPAGTWQETTKLLSSAMTLA